VLETLLSLLLSEKIGEGTVAGAPRSPEVERLHQEIRERALAPRSSGERPGLHD
jgi:hypothetical protein